MLLEHLKKLYRPEHIKIEEPMAFHTSFKVGGPVSALLFPDSVEQIAETQALCKAHDVPCLVMGNGSNLLVEDSGLNAVVLKIGEGFQAVSVEGEEIVAEAGILLSNLSRIAEAHILSGLEFASGIPGTLGGALFMNAGAYGGEMKDVVRWVDVLTPEGTCLRVTGEALEFGYRTSRVRRENWIALRAGLTLKSGDAHAIRELTASLTERRVSKQPLNMPSAGSTFKRPPGHYAGQLIESCGLRGVRFGDAQVSEKHCGFVVNAGHATCSEILALVGMIQKTVWNQKGIALEREIRLFGRE